MLFAAYAIFFVLIVWAFRRIAAGRTPKHEGSPWRPATLVVSLASLLLFVTLVPQQHAGNLSALIVVAGITGSALYAIGAAVWTGVGAYRLRALGWGLNVIAFGIPSTLTLAVPLVALLAFPLAPLSRHSIETQQAGGAAA